MCAPVRTLREALKDAQTHHNEMIIEGVDADQTLQLVGSPIRMTGAPVSMRRPPPRLGEHTDEVLAEVRATQP